MDPNDNIVCHISKLENSSKKLKQFGDPIPGSMVVTKILMTLPKNYKHFYNAWDSISDNKKTLSNLTARLMLEETRQTQEHEIQKEIAGISAFIAKKSFGAQKQKCIKNGDSENQRSDRKSGKCNNCKKPGHLKRDCRIFKTENNKKQLSSGYALIGTKLKGSEISDSEKWYLDFEASDHMTNRKE